jgi:hypothetical protein
LGQSGTGKTAGDLPGKKFFAMRDYMAKLVAISRLAKLNALNAMLRLFLEFDRLSLPF